MFMPLAARLQFAASTLLARVTQLLDLHRLHPDILDFVRGLSGVGPPRCMHSNSRAEQSEHDRPATALSDTIRPCAPSSVPLLFFLPAVTIPTTARPQSELPKLRTTKPVARQRTSWCPDTAATTSCRHCVLPQPSKGIPMHKHVGSNWMIASTRRRQKFKRASMPSSRKGDAVSSASTQQPVRPP